MKEEFINICRYVFFIAKKMILWLLLVLGILALPEMLGNTKFTIPGFVSWLIGYIGLIWTGYKVYQEQQKVVPPGKEIIKLKRQPRISVALVEGNEISYKLNSIDEYHIIKKFPSGELELHTKITNEGSSDAEIMSIKGSFYPHGLWYVNDLNQSIYNNTKNDIKFPYCLHTEDKLITHMLFPIKPSVALNEAQIKDRLLRHQKKDDKLKVRISIEIRDTYKKIQNIHVEKELPTEQVVELYLAMLNEANRQ